MTNEGKERKIKTYYKLYWASLVTQTVKNLPAMQKTQVRFLGWEDPLEEKKLPTPVIWQGEFHELYCPWNRRVRHH